MNYQIRLPFRIFLFFLIIGCSEKAEESQSTKEVQAVLRPVGLTKLPTGSTMGFLTSSISYNWDEENKEGVISIYNVANNSILNFKEDNPIDYQEIILEEDGPNSVGNLGLLASHLYHNEDSIFIYNNPLGKLFLINTEGSLIDSYLITDYKSKENFPAPFPSTLRPFFQVNNSILIPCGINNYLDKYTNYPSTLSLDLKTKKISYTSVYPEIYDQAFWGVSFKWDTGLAINYSKAQIIFNYPISNELYTSDLSFTESKAINITSKYFDSPQPFSSNPKAYLDINKKFDYKSMENEAMSHSDFAGILYDEFNKVYYRIVYLRPNLEEVKAGNKAPNFSIITLDENLQKIGEDFFDQKTYDNSMIFVSSKGLNIARKDLFYENEELIQFEVFTPKKNKTQFNKKKL